VLAGRVQGSARPAVDARIDRSRHRRTCGPVDDGGLSMKTLLRWIATLGPIGFSPVAPASGASAIVALAWWFIPTPPLLVLVGVIAVLTGFGIWVCHEAEKTLGHDAHPIVFDELVGQTIALLWVPKTLVAYAAAFFLFRVFDVWKPLGAREAQRLPGGLGIVTDDVIARIAACGVYHLGAKLLGH